MHVCMHFWTEYLAIVILKVTHHICSFKGNLHIYMVEKGIFKKKYIFKQLFVPRCSKRPGTPNDVIFVSYVASRVQNQGT